MIPITDERPSDADAIEALLDTCFGPGRTAKTVYRLRAGVDPASGLSLVARDGTDALVGTIRCWPVRLGEDARPSLLLGPVAVDPSLQGRGLGGALIRETLARAADLGHAGVILVGDAPYYARFGFARPPVERLALPGPVDLSRFLGHEIVPGALSGATGLVRPGRRTGAGVPRTADALRPDPCAAIAGAL
ncbi:MAG: GNAT family N-acetyltransferase [Rhodospirillales bacterium]|jgi:predicted N-acetyltransferase YhbS